MTFGTPEQNAYRDAREAARNGADGTTAIRVVTVEELLRLKIPARQYLIEPWLREKETVMVHAWRGVGKTLLGLNVAYMVASGGTFLGWRAPRPRSVLYLDGEMPAQTMQERLAAIVHTSDNADSFDPANLRFVCADLQDTALPNLSTHDGQVSVEPLLAGVPPSDAVPAVRPSRVAISRASVTSSRFIPRMSGW